jgi:multiple sugar transport system substrate-binding protein
MLHWTQAMSTWAEEGILLPLDSLMTSEEKRVYFHEAFPVIRKSGWYRGRLYGVTEGFDLAVIYYRLDHFREAGLDPDAFPQTLEALVTLGGKLHRFDKAGNLTRLGFLPQGLTAYVAAFGGGFYSEQTDTVLLNTPENLRALTFLVEERKKLGLDNVLRFTSALTSTSGLDWPFISGAFSIALDGEWRVEQLRRFAPHLEYRTIPLPPPAGGRPHSSFSVTNFLTIPKAAKEVDGAWEFIRFWTGLVQPARAAEYYPWFGWMPMSSQQAQTPVYQDYLNRNPQYRTFLEVALSKNIVITPPVPYQLYLMDRISRADDLATRGTLTPEQALLQLESDVRQEKARRKELGYA